MMYAKGLGTTFSDGTSKGAREELLHLVVKGYNVLLQRNVIDSYSTLFPDEMEKLDKALVVSFLTSDQVLVSVVVKVRRD